VVAADVVSELRLNAGGLAAGVVVGFMAGEAGRRFLAGAALASSRRRDLHGHADPAPA
jgi:hypothetical protein